MTREQKYPDTATFHFHNHNSHGRITSDCVARAISTSTGIDYDDVVMELARLQVKTGYDTTDAKLYTKYLESLGYRKQAQPRKANGKKYTGAEYCKQFKPANVIAHIGGNHIVAIIDGRVWDTWDSTDGCIGNVFVKR